MPHETYSLGCGVLEKGGGTKEFSSRLIVIPQYNAVLAISATYDCGTDVKAEILQLFAVAMLERDVNIWKNHQPVPQQDAENYQGLYLTGGRSLRVLIEGRGWSYPRRGYGAGDLKLYTNLLYQDGEMVWKPDYRFFFYQHEGKRYSMAKVQNRSFPWPSRPTTVSASRCQRPKGGIGKQYRLPTSLRRTSSATAQRAQRLQLLTTSEVLGPLIASLVNDSREGKAAYFEILVPLHRRQALRPAGLRRHQPAPSKAGRDLLNFILRNRRRRNLRVQRLPLPGSLLAGELAGTGLPLAAKKTSLLAGTGSAHRAARHPEGDGLLLFNPEGSVAFDSLLDERFQPVEEGYISLI